MELIPRYLGLVIWVSSLLWNVDVIHDPYVLVSRVPVHGLPVREERAGRRSPARQRCHPQARGGLPDGNAPVTCPRPSNTLIFIVKIALRICILRLK